MGEHLTTLSSTFLSMSCLPIIGTSKAGGLGINHNTVKTHTSLHYLGVPVLVMPITCRL